MNRNDIDNVLHGRQRPGAKADGVWIDVTRVAAEFDIRIPADVTPGVWKHYVTSYKAGDTEVQDNRLRSLFWVVRHAMINKEGPVAEFGMKVRTDHGSTEVIDFSAFLAGDPAGKPRLSIQLAQEAVSRTALFASKGGEDHEPGKAVERVRNWIDVRGGKRHG